MITFQPESDDHTGSHPANKRSVAEMLAGENIGYVNFDYGNTQCSYGIGHPDGGMRIGGRVEYYPIG